MKELTNTDIKNLELKLKQEHAKEIEQLQLQAQEEDEKLQQLEESYKELQLQISHLENINQDLNAEVLNKQQEIIQLKAGLESNENGNQILSIQQNYEEIEK